MQLISNLFLWSQLASPTIHIYSISRLFQGFFCDLGAFVYYSYVTELSDPNGRATLIGMVDVMCGVTGKWLR